MVNEGEDFIDFYDLCIISSDVPVDTYDDEDLMDFIINVRNTAPKFTRVVRFTNGYVTKQYDRFFEVFPDMKAAVDFAVSLGLPVPPIKRVVDLPEYDFVECIQPYIKNGTELEKIWSKLGMLPTLYLGWTLRRTIKRMHNSKPPRADGGGGGLLTGKCRSHWFAEDHPGVPDYATARQFNEIVNFWSNVDWRSNTERDKTTQEHFQTCEQGPISLSEEKNPYSTLGFVHGDLAPRNIVLQRKGLKMKLWLIDWDYAGWYPKYTEFAGMQNNILDEKWSKWDNRRWHWFSWLSGGRVYSKQTDMMNDMLASTRMGGYMRTASIAAGASSGPKRPGPTQQPKGVEEGQRNEAGHQPEQDALGEKLVQTGLVNQPPQAVQVGDAKVESSTEHQKESIEAGAAADDEQQKAKDQSFA